ncbi:MAG: PH domain-containing protein [Candidatus Saccharimonadales bacterium]
MSKRQSPNPVVNDSSPQSDYSQPAAYDVDGRPLYAHPPQRVGPKLSSSMVDTVSDEIAGENFDPRLRKQYANEPDLVHVYRPIEPKERPLSTKLQALHEQSKVRFPSLNLSKGEHVIIAVRRHPIGLIIPIGITGFLLTVLLALLFSYPLLQRDGYFASLPGVEVIVLPVLLLVLLVGIGGYVAAWVYLQNRFYMTNESVIQEIQLSLFSRREQTVSLGSIEDASFLQTGILELLFGYGTIRLSTEGEETTYRFQFVAEPKRQIAILNNAVEAFKNGRPVELDDHTS